MTEKIYKIIAIIALIGVIALSVVVASLNNQLNPAPKPTPIINSLTIENATFLLDSHLHYTKYGVMLNVSLVESNNVTIFSNNMTVTVNGEQPSNDLYLYHVDGNQYLLEIIDYEWVYGETYTFGLTVISITATYTASAPTL